MAETQNLSCASWSLDKVAKLQQKMQEADDERRGVVEQAAECQLKLDLAERLVNGLADENARWTDSMAELEASKSTVIGNYLLAAAFVSYAGAFSAPFRVGLVEVWNRRAEAPKVPLPFSWKS